MSALLRNRWALFPVAMLCGSVCLGVVTVSAALQSHGESEPDFYRKGVQWDAHRAQIARNGALAWTLTPTIRAAGDGAPVPTVEVAVADKHGVPIADATVSLEVVPILAADMRMHMRMNESRPGVYVAECPVRVDGAWELRFSVESRGRTYADSVRRVVHGVMAGGSP